MRSILLCLNRQRDNGRVLICIPSWLRNTGNGRSASDEAVADGGTRRMDVYAARLTELIQADAWFSSILKAVRDCDPPDWLVGGGVLRNLAWDHLHGYTTTATALRHVDVAYFDAGDLRNVRDHEVERCLCARLPGVPWQAKNQAAVHLWYERVFGFPVQPLASSADGVGT